MLEPFLEHNKTEIDNLQNMVISLTLFSISRPSSVFLLAVASVILNTYAVVYALSFKYAVVISPLLAMIQAFLSLPFQVVKSENSVQ